MYVERILKRRRYSNELGARDADLIEHLRAEPEHNNVMALPEASQSTIEYPPVFDTCCRRDATDYSLLERDKPVPEADSMYRADDSITPSSGSTKTSETKSTFALRVTAISHQAPSTTSISRHAKPATPITKTVTPQ